MYSNIGRKIKMLAMCLFGLGVLASVVFAIITLSVNFSVKGFLFGLAILILGSLLSWVCSFFTYGFGELIESNNEIKKILLNQKPSDAIPEKKIIPVNKIIPVKFKKTKAEKSVPTQAPPVSTPLTREEKILAEGGWKCSKCGKLNYAYSASCPDCGSKKYQSIES